MFKYEIDREQVNIMVDISKLHKPTWLVEEIMDHQNGMKTVRFSHREGSYCTDSYGRSELEPYMTEYFDRNSKLQFAEIHQEISGNTGSEKIVVQMTEEESKEGSGTIVKEYVLDYDQNAVDLDLQVGKWHLSERILNPDESDYEFAPVHHQWLKFPEPKSDSSEPQQQQFSSPSDE